MCGGRLSRSVLTFCGPMGLLPARLLCSFPSRNTGEVAISYSRKILRGPGMEPAPLESPAVAGGFLTTSTTWEVHMVGAGVVRRGRGTSPDGKGFTELEFRYFIFFVCLLLLFLMWIIFKVFTEFVKYCFCFFLFLLLLFYGLGFWGGCWWLGGTWDLISPTRVQTYIPCVGRPSLNHWITREVPQTFVFNGEKTLSPVHTLLIPEG